MRLLILLAIVGCALAVPKSINRIVGGSPTTVSQYPYMANMQYRWFGNFWSQSCGGSLLTSTTILSASHCYIGDPPSLWRVRLGTSFASSGGSIHAVSQLQLHPEYNDNTLVADVAIIRLATPAIVSANIGFASIAGPNYNIADGSIVTSVGWGSLSSGGPLPEQLRHVDTNVINQELCAERYAYLKTQPGYANWPDITDGMICAGILDVGGRDACQGDSGGPLAQNGNVLVGVTSWGFGCADSFYPGVNARVSYYSNWIIANGSG